MTLVQSLRSHGALVNLKPNGMMRIVPPPRGMVLDFGARRQLFADLHQERRWGLAILCMLRSGEGGAQLDRALALDHVQPCEHCWLLETRPGNEFDIVTGHIPAPVICGKCGSPGVGA